MAVLVSSPGDTRHLRIDPSGYSLLVSSEVPQVLDFSWAVV